MKGELSMKIDGFTMVAWIRRNLSEKCSFDVIGISPRVPKNIKVSLTGLGYDFGFLNGLGGRLATLLSKHTGATGNVKLLKIDELKLVNFLNNFLNNNFDCSLLQ